MDINKPPQRTRIGYVFLVFFILTISKAELKGQMTSNIMPGYQNAWAAAASTGATFDGNSWFWGVATDYSRLFSERWIINGSIAYDQETSKSNNNSDQVDNTFSAQVALGYQLSPRAVIGGGFAKGLVENRQGSSSWKGISFGDDWATGLVGVYTFWINGPHSLDVSGALEYRISESKWGYSFDIGYGYSF